MICMSTAEQGELGVSSYGISVTTMEEVFMKVREGADETLSHRLTALSPPHVIPSNKLLCQRRDLKAIKQTTQRTIRTFISLPLLFNVYVFCKTLH